MYDLNHSELTMKPSKCVLDSKDGLHIIFMEVDGTSFHSTTEDCYCKPKVERAPLTGQLMYTHKEEL